MTTPHGVVGEFAEPDQPAPCARLVTVRRVACFDYGADLGFHGMPLCDSMPDFRDRLAHEIGYAVGLEMARQQDKERGKK